MKILEFVEKKQLAPVGGPLGYTFALYKADEKNGFLYFLEDVLECNEDGTKIKRRKNNFYYVILKYLRFLKSVLIGSKDEIIESNAYDAIHFHSTFDLYKYRKSLKKFKGITLLTSHSPTLASKELFSSAKLIEKILFWPIFLLLKFADKRSFKIPNYVIFPCEYAEEPYIHSWKGFLSLKAKNHSKFKYLITGTYRRYPLVSGDEIRKKYNIPLSSKIVCFAGRHNKIKGYDILKKIATKMLLENKDLYFLIVGKEGPIKKLFNDRWIEVGWTKDPHSFIAASDVFVLPNRETYFDLVFLEALSLGQLVVASRTGGNKFFESFHENGIREFSTVDEAINEINDILNIAPNERSSLKESNLKLFEKEFTDSTFYKNYIELLQDLLTKNE